MDHVELAALLSVLMYLSHAAKGDDSGEAAKRKFDNPRGDVDIGLRRTCLPCRLVVLMYRSLTFRHHSQTTGLGGLPHTYTHIHTRSAIHAV